MNSQKIGECLKRNMEKNNVKKVREEIERALAGEKSTNGTDR